VVIYFEIGQKNDKKEQIQQKSAVMAVEWGLLISGVFRQGFEVYDSY
jgi:hypothetical protein